jgi:hypothetical protein
MDGNRRNVLLAAIVLSSVGLAVFFAARNSMIAGTYESILQSPGYYRPLSYSEISVIGSLIAGTGIMLGIASIGIGKWPRYAPQEYYIDDVKAVGVSIATADYERDIKIVQDIMRKAELMFHTRDEFVIDEPTSRMGWYFFVVHVTPNLVDRVADYTDQLQQNKEEKFVDWFQDRLREQGCNVYLQLESKKGSSKYGLF